MKQIKRIVTGKVLVMVFSGLLLFPVAGNSQDPEENDADQQAVEAPSSTGAGPWENSAGATIGTRDNGTTTSAARPDPRLGPGGGTLGRPAAPLAGGPGGNPDVPFDENMNLAFLIAGVLFAFFVLRRKMGLKAVAVKNK